MSLAEIKGVQRIDKKWLKKKDIRQTQEREKQKRNKTEQRRKKGRKESRRDGRKVQDISITDEMRRYCVGNKRKQDRSRREIGKMKKVNGSGDVTVCQRSHVPNSMIVDAVLCGCQNEKKNMTGTT